MNCPHCVGLVMKGLFPWEASCLMCGRTYHKHPQDLPMKGPQPRNMMKIRRGKSEAPQTKTR